MTGLTSKSSQEMGSSSSSPTADFAGLGDFDMQYVKELLGCSFEEAVNSETGSMSATGGNEPVLTSNIGKVTATATLKASGKENFGSEKATVNDRKVQSSFNSNSVASSYQAMSLPRHPPSRLPFGKASSEKQVGIQPPFKSTARPPLAPLGDRSNHSTRGYDHHPSTGLHPTAVYPSASRFSFSQSRPKYLVTSSRNRLPFAGYHHHAWAQYEQYTRSNRSMQGPSSHGHPPFGGRQYPSVPYSGFGNSNRSKPAQSNSDRPHPWAPHSSATVLREDHRRQNTVKTTDARLSSAKEQPPSKYSIAGIAIPDGLKRAPKSASNASPSTAGTSIRVHTASGDAKQHTAAAASSKAASRRGCEISMHGNIKFIWYTGVSDYEHLKKSQSQPLNETTKHFRVDSSHSIRYHYFHDSDGHLVFYYMYCFTRDRLIRACRCYPGIEGTGQKIMRVYVVNEHSAFVGPTSSIVNDIAGISLPALTSIAQRNRDEKGLDVHPPCCDGNGGLTCPLFQRLLSLCSHR